MQHPYAANTVLELVRTMFNWGKVVGLVPKDHADPTAGIVRFPVRKRRRYITTVEMPGFIQALEAEDNEYARHGLWLLLLLGLRSTELLHAKWSDVDWDTGTLFVGLTKNGEPLLAPLGDAAIERLKNIPRIPNNPYIICGNKRGRTQTGLGRALRRVLRRAGLQNLRVHDLRRTVGSWLAQAGLSLHLIGDVLNHRDLRTTQGYALFPDPAAARCFDGSREQSAFSCYRPAARQHGTLVRRHPSVANRRAIASPSLLQARRAPRTRVDSSCLRGRTPTRHIGRRLGEVVPTGCDPDSEAGLLGSDRIRSTCTSNASARRAPRIAITAEDSRAGVVAALAVTSNVGSRPRLCENSERNSRRCDGFDFSVEKIRSSNART